MHQSIRLSILAASLLSAVAFAPTAQALEAGDFLVYLRLINIDPTGGGDNVTSSAVGGTVPNTETEVEDDATLDISFTYMLTRNVGIGVLGDITSKHDVYSDGSTLQALAPGKIISSRVLPPAVFLSYHFAPQAAVRPYAALGVNYAHFYNESATDSLENGLGGISNLDIDDSWGLAAQVGVDIDLGNDWSLNFDLKYMGIETTASFDSGALGHVETDVDINPVVYGIGIGKRF